MLNVLAITSMVTTDMTSQRGLKSLTLAMILSPSREELPAPEFRKRLFDRRGFLVGIAYRLRALPRLKSGRRTGVRGAL